MDGSAMETSTSGRQPADDTDSSDSEFNTQGGDKHGSSSSDLDSSASESDSSIEIRPKKPKTALIDSDSENSESDWDIAPSTSSRLPQLDESSSSSESDGQSDKCPICLAKFKGQEIGSPDSCEHTFCYECILEWSKNVTTCPIDRQQFKLILVKKHLDGSVIRQTSVEEQAEFVPEPELIDPTFCEVCRNCDREDRMLLCDGCDLGYHLECLNPPLVQVPQGSWHCPDCGPEDLQQDITIYVNELEVLYHDAEEIGAPANVRRVPRSNNMVPRTRQSDRIRARIISNRQNNRISTVVGRNNIQVTVDQTNQPSTSGRTTTTTSIARSVGRQPAAGRRVTQKRRKRRKARKPRIKITYEIDQTTGKKIVIETKSYRKRRKTRKRKTKSGTSSRRRLAKALSATRTTKRRLAQQFNICAPSKPGQMLPDVRITSENTTSIQQQRAHAGIPALSLFGNRDEVDFFSGSDENDEGDGGSSAGGSLLTRRRPNYNDAVMLRRSLARKSRTLPRIDSTQSSSSVDLLGSIMETQEKMHSKNAVLSLNRDGSLKIDTNRNNVVETNRNRVNPNDRQHVRTRTAPSYSTNDNPANIANVNSPQECHNDDDAGGSMASSSAGAGTGTGTISNNSVSTSSVFGSGASGSNAGVTGGPNTCGGDRQTDADMDPSDVETVSTSKVEAEDSDKDEPSAEKLPRDGETEGDVIKDAQEEGVSSTTNTLTHQQTDDRDRSVENTDDEECPNFSIYSKDTINLVANRNLEQDEVGSSFDVQPPPVEAVDQQDDHAPPPHSDGDDNDEDVLDVKTPKEDAAEGPTLEESGTSKDTSLARKSSDNLYSDSDEEVVKTDTRSFGIGDIRDITEDISDEERSYTPCLDERGPVREGIEGLDTEAISEDEKNDFDESHEHKTTSDGGDALEINAKESEMDFTKPEDYEEGEIVDKLKKLEAAILQTGGEESTTPVKKNESDVPVEKEATSFKRIAKNTNRNYRDKERSRSHSKEKNKENEREKKRDRKKDKRKELERYNVRNVVTEKPRKGRKSKDEFGRDTRRRSLSRSSRSPTYSPPPYRSGSRGRRSFSRERRKRRAGRSRDRSSPRSRSRSNSRARKRSVSRKRRSLSRPKRRRSVDDKKRKKRSPSASRHRSRSRSRTRTPAGRRRDWDAHARQRWSPSASRSRTPERQASPSWTPPRIHDSTNVKPHNLTVILTNDANKSKKKDKRKSEKRKKETVEKAKKRKRDKSPAPSKEVFASGDNILVSVSFNKDSEEVAKRTKPPREGDDSITTKRTRKEKEKRRERTCTPPPPAAAKPRKKKQPQQDLSGVKPVAIIDLDRSPFKELTPSPKDVIVLSDSDQSPEKVAPDSSQQADYALGPKTPPEPQVKFALTTKAPQLRQITNPLHDPDDELEETELDPQDELEQRLNDAMHKGPNTPSEPPNSPPSSPDAYDPFDPTKSRSPTPEQEDTMAMDNEDLDDSIEQDDIPLAKTPDAGAVKSHTPPLADIQPADSQTNLQLSAGGTTSPEDSISEQATQMSLSANAQGNSPIFTPKPKLPAAAALAAAVASTPTSSSANNNSTTPRVNILNSTIITPILGTAQAQQRNAQALSNAPPKPSPTKAAVKQMPKRTAAAATAPKTASKSAKVNRSTDSNDSMDLDSPYSPGPSDFEDLFEPPTEHKSKPKAVAASTPTKAANKSSQNTFDVLFGSPGNKSKSKSSDRGKKGHSKIKQVGVKFDDDSLKILDDLPNSAVEMQVKDKFLKKLNRQERVVEEVKLVLKPHYNKKHINKDEYKDILRRAVPKICHNKAGEINPMKIQSLIEAYVKKVRHSKKVTSSSSVSAQK